MAENYKVPGSKLHNACSNGAIRKAIKSGALNPAAASEPLWHRLGVKGKTKKFVQHLSLRRLNSYQTMRGKRGLGIGDLLCSL